MEPSEVDLLADSFRPLARLTLLDVLVAAMKEVSHDLAPGSVGIRLDGPDADFVLTPPPAPRQAEVPAAEALKRDAGHGPTPLERCREAEGRIRLRFATSGELEEAAAVFDSAHADRDALMLSIPSDGSVSVLRFVLDALTDRDLEPETLAVQLSALDDVFLSIAGDHGSDTRLE